MGGDIQAPVGFPTRAGRRRRRPPETDEVKKTIVYRAVIKAVSAAHHLDKSTWKCYLTLGGFAGDGIAFFYFSAAARRSFMILNP